MDQDDQDEVEPGRARDSSSCPCRRPQRRSHKKSRNGCRNCKRRRIKCDETKPTCDNCARGSIPCDFDASNQTPAAAAIASAPRKRGRPFKKWVPSPETPADSPGPRLSSTSGAPLPLPLNVDDLQLYHHYITSTCLTLGDDLVWRDKVPLLAFENPFILRLMLAFAALHLARLRATEAAKYLQQAEMHHAEALPAVTDLLPRISRDNCSALYIATVLVCDYMFAKPPEKGHLILVADGNEVSWWNLFRGVRFIVETMGLPAVFSGHLAPFPPEFASHPPPSETQDYGYIAWERPLTDLTERMIGSKEPGLGNLPGICDALADCFRETYGTAEQPQDGTHGKMHVVMRWLWFVENDFIQQVKEMKPEALIILAHFAVLLQTLECFWFMRGWAHRVMDGIIDNLGADDMAWISWPQRQIGPRPEDGN